MYRTKTTKQLRKIDGTLYANATIDHILTAWVTQEQAEFHERASISFEGPKLYSYRAHIATVYPKQGVILVVPYGHYTPTTSAHCSDAAYCGRHNGFQIYHYGPTREDMRQVATAHVIECQERIIRGQKNNSYWRWCSMKDQIVKINEMLDAFCEKPLLPVTEFAETSISFKMKYHVRLKGIRGIAITRKLTHERLI